MAIVVDYFAEARPIQVSDLLYRASVLLQDESNVRWPVAELISWMNEGVGALIRLKPAAGARRTIFALESGTLQHLDDSVVQLIDIVRNVAGDSYTPGRVVRLTDRQLLDATNPDWHTMKKSASIRHYTYDDRTPAIFYVYPPAMPNTMVEALLSVLPVAADAEADYLSVNVEFSDSILNYMLYRAFGKDNEYANAAMATGYYQAFIASMGTGEQGEQTTTPTNKVPA
jgi:hypothetical protein